MTKRPPPDRVAERGASSRELAHLVRARPTGGAALVIAMANNPPTPQMAAAVPLLAIISAAVGSLPAADQHLRGRYN